MPPLQGSRPGNLPIPDSASSASHPGPDNHPGKMRDQMQGYIDKTQSVEDHCFQGLARMDDLSGTPGQQNG